jgi:hypothetical protein
MFKWVVAVFICGIGLLMSAAGLKSMARILTLLSNGARTQGIVARLDKDGCPVVEFTGPSGEKRNISGAMGSSNAPATGTPLPVIYTASDAMINTFGQMWGAPVFVFCFGLIFVLAGLLVFGVMAQSDGSGGMIAELLKSARTPLIAKWCGVSLFSLLGIGLFVWGVKMARERTELWRTGVHTSGTVTDFENKQRETKDNRGMYVTVTYYHPVVDFAGPDGKTVTFTSDLGASSPGFKKGETVPVIYPANSPQKARIASVMQFWLGPIALVALGAVTVAVLAFVALKL